MIAMTVSTILVGALAVLASATRQTSDFNSGQSAAVQHARVVHDRLQRFVGEAYATETYPGVVVVDETVSSQSLLRHRRHLASDRCTPTNAAGPPLVKELIIIGPDPNDPKRLMEFTAPTDTRTIQLNDASLNTTTGRTLVSSIKTASTTIKTLAHAAGAHGIDRQRAARHPMRAAVRFECELHPTAAEMTSYRGGSLAWEDIAWPQGWFSTSCGMRQVWLRSEIATHERRIQRRRHAPDDGDRPAVSRLRDELLQPHAITNTRATRP